MSKPTVPPVQFTKDELRMIDKGVEQFMREWYHGYKSAGRVLRAAGIREKVRAALGIPSRSSSAERRSTDSDLSGSSRERGSE